MSHLTSDRWAELIFNNRNKNYGAFRLRKSANEHQVYGLVIANLIFIALIVIYKVSLSASQKAISLQHSAFTFKNNFEKTIENQVNPLDITKELSKVVAVESDIDLQFMNLKVVERIQVPKIEPMIKDISNGVLKYSVDAETGKHFIPQRQAAFKGGMDSFYVSITKQIKFKSELGLPNYRYENGDDEIDYEINTLVFVECVITATGKLDSVKLFKGASDPKFNDRVLAAFRNSKEWKPAIHNGKAVSQKMIIPFHFDYKQPLIKYYQF